MSKFMRAGFKLFDLLIIFVMVFGAPMSALAAPSPTGATITSDQADYPPGGTVTLTGTGWAAGESVHIVVNDTIGQTWSRDVTVTADEFGNLTDVFSLPTYFVSDYDVTASGPISGDATTTFTDTNLPASVQLRNWETKPSGSWVTATLGTNNSDYKEGETIPFQLDLGNLNASGNPYYAPVCRDYANTPTGPYGYTTLMPFDTSRAATPGGTISDTDGAFTGVGIDITGVQDLGASSGSALGSGTFNCGSTQQLVIVRFDVTGSGTKYLLWGGRLSAPGDTNPDIAFGNSSSFYPGGSLQMRLASPDKTAGINPGAIIQLAKLTVTKVVDSGSATPDQWCFTVTGPNSYNSTQCVPAGQSSVDFIGLDTGSYTVTESSVAGYSFVSGSGTNCTFSGSTATATVTAAAGGATNASCTFHNAVQQGTLTVIKHVINDNGGTASAGDWSIHVQTGGNEVTGSPQAGAESPGTSYTLTAGTYNVSETGGPSGYTFTGFSGDCDSSGNVTVVAGQTKTCTLTNDDQTAHLKLVKVVVNDNGGTASESDWTLSASGPTNLSGSGPTVESDVDAGSYALSESGGPAGYTTNGYDCGSSVSLALGESKTCTITNDDQPASITVIKVVDNTAGGTAEPDDFNLTLEGSPVNSGVAVTVNAGTYTAGETLLSGYSFDGFSGDCDTNGDVTVGLGESKTCTLSNSAQQSYVIVEKVVINDNGGSAEPDDFNLTLDGNATTSGALIPVAPGTYTAGETQLSGYTFEGFSGDCDDNGQVTVALGETKTCTLTNNDQQASIIVEKVVINDDGGSADPDDFNLTLDGNATTSGALIPVAPGTYTAGETQLSGYTFEGFSGDCDSNGDVTVALGETKTCTLTNNDEQAYITVVKVVNNTHGGTAQPDDFNLTLEGSAVSSGVAVAVDPGTYTAGETQLSGYTFEGFSGDCNSSGDITVALGESKTCTLTNSDQQAYITVIKVVTNNNGGTAQPNDFNLTLDGNAVSSGVAVAVNPGTYTAGETLVSGYSFVGFSGDCNSNGDVTVALGESKTCTLTNDDKAPILHLRKIVVNDNGGSKTVADFTLSANGTGSNDLSGTSPVDSGAGLKADTWALSETTQYGYTASAWSCVGGTQNGSNITLGIGEEATCTITNDDQPGTIIVKKIVKGTNLNTSFSFTTTGTGYNNFSLSGGTENSQTLNAGSYSVTELVPLGWVLTGIGGSSDPNTPYACTVSGSGGSSGSGDLNTMTASITLNNGDTVTCVFENTGPGVTRTQGFWATHPQLADIAWFGGTAFGHTFPGVANTAGIGDTLICGRPLDDLGKVMGGFWSDIAKKSTGVKRASLDQARMQLLQQLLAAELNASAFGSVPSVGSFAAWENALCNGTANQVKQAQQQAASFNSQGDNSTFTPGTSADSKYARSIANIPFWDIIKP